MMDIRLEAQAQFMEEVWTLYSNMMDRECSFFSIDMDEYGIVYNALLLEIFRKHYIDQTCIFERMLCWHHLYDGMTVDCFHPFFFLATMKRIFGFWMYMSLMTWYCCTYVDELMFYGEV